MSTCFGQYDKKAAECRRCLKPVVKDKKLWLFAELCEAATEGREAKKLKRLTSREVLARLKAGKSAEEILEEMGGAEAWPLLRDRFWQVRQWGYETPGRPATLKKEREG